MSAYSARPCPRSAVFRRRTGRSPARPAATASAARPRRPDAPLSAPKLVHRLYLRWWTGRLRTCPSVRRSDSDPRRVERPFLAATSRMMMKRRVCRVRCRWTGPGHRSVGARPSYSAVLMKDECAGSATGAIVATRVQATATYRAGSADGMALMSHRGRCVKSPGAGPVRQATGTTRGSSSRSGVSSRPMQGATVDHTTTQDDWVNPRDPARALGADGQPGPQPPRAVLGGRARRAVGRLALAALQPRQRPGDDRADPGADRRGARGPGRAGQVPRRHHALLHQPHRPGRPERPDPPPGHPPRSRAAGLHGDDGGLAGRGPPLAGARPGAPLPGPRADAGHHAVRLLLPLLHAVAHRGRRRPRTSTARPRGAARLPAPHAPGARRADLRRRPADAGAEAARTCPARPARDPAHRDHPHRHARAGLPAAAHRRRAVRDARAVPPALDQPPLQPPQRDHARGLARGRQADAAPASRSATSRCCWPASTTASTSSARSSTSWSRTGSGPTTSTSATWSRAPGTSGRRSARASRSSRACAATPPATPCRPTSSTRRAAAARSRSCPTTSSATPTTRSCCATTRATSRPTRSRTDYQRHDSAPAAPTAGTSAPSPASAACTACSRATDVDRASRLRGDPHPRQRRSSTASRSPRSGCPTASGAIEGQAGRPLPVLGAGDGEGQGAGAGAITSRGDDGEAARLRPGRGAATPRGRAHGVGARGAALAPGGLPAAALRRVRRR